MVTCCSTCATRPRRDPRKLPQIHEMAIDYLGIDMIEEPVPVRPGMHYQMGGVETDIDGASPLPGLYAAGEVACVSVHGGNRLGANSLLDTIVFGRRSGKAAAGVCERNRAEHGRRRTARERAAAPAESCSTGRTRAKPRRSASRTRDDDG